MIFCYFSGMQAQFSESFFHFLDAHGIKRPEAAALLGVDERSLSNYRSRGLPKSKHALAERIMREKQATKTPSAEESENRLSISFDDADFDLIQQAAAIVKTPIKDFVKKAAVSGAEKELSAHSLKGNGTHG
jgi:hypothetical protein